MRHSIDDLRPILERFAGPPTAVQADAANPIAAGARNATLTSLAGTMRRSGMSEAAMLAALRITNGERCQPPLDDSEIRTIAHSVGKYPPAEQPEPALTHAPKSIGQLCKDHPELRRPVIHGFVREGETANIIAPPKGGKSWLTLNLGIAVASGRDWLGLRVEQGDVLIIDNELHPQTLANRPPRVAGAMNVPMKEIADHLFIESVRGRKADIYSLTPYFASIDPGRYKIIVIDALYRCWPPGHDENDNSAVTAIYNTIDSYSDRLGAAFILVHHTSKGLQGNKAVSDVGAGAGAISRAADSHLILRPHRTEGVVVLDSILRSWPPMTRRCLRWDFPLWRPVDDDLDPSQLKAEQRPRKSGKTKVWTAAAFTEAFVTTEPRWKESIISAAVEARETSEREAERLLSLAEDQGLAHRSGGTGGRRAMYATIPTIAT